MSSARASNQYHLSFDWEALRESERRFMQASKASNTLIAYAAQWRFFTRWCEGTQVTPLPATAETLRLFITWALAVNHNRVTTVKLTLTSIADRHRQAKLPNPFTREVGEFFLSCRRCLKQQPQGKLALTAGQLRAICAGLTLSDRDVRDRAILLTGFATGWRSSELASLRVSDVSFASEGVLLYLRKSKTDQKGLGRVLGVQYGETEATCPVRALQSWLERRSSREGSLFLRMDNAGRITAHGITSRTVCRVVKKHLERSGLGDPAHYGAHSMRAGMVSEAAGNGVSPLAIMERTGHQSVEMVMRYIRPRQAFRFNPLAGVL